MPPIERVLMTADAVGGVWAFALDLARILTARGVKVTLAVTGPAPSADQLGEVRAIDGVQCHHHSSRLEWMADPWDDVASAGAWLLSLAAANAPDVIHLNGYCHAALEWPAPVVVTGHSCVLSWWRAVHGSAPPAEWEAYATRVNQGVRAADLVTAPTAAMLDELERHYGPLGRTMVIANGREVTPVPSVAKEQFILTAGRLWDDAKNIAAVCAVAPTLPWPVRVAGDRRSPDGTDVPCDGVDHLGRLGSEALAAWMARASIYVLPARYEPFGLSALEAALAGCALVLGDIRSLREVWGDAAYYVPPDNHRMLRRALDALIDDASLRAAMGRRANARARLFTAERMADGYLAAYATLVPGPRPATWMAC